MLGLPKRDLSRDRVLKVRAMLMILVLGRDSPDRAGDENRTNAKTARATDFERTASSAVETVLDRLNYLMPVSAQGTSRFSEMV